MVTGLREWLARLAALRAAAGKLDAPAQAAAEALVPAARARARRRTGAMAAAVSATDGRLTSSVRWGPVQEFGWAGHNITPNRYARGAAEAASADQITTPFREHLDTD